MIHQPEYVKVLLKKYTEGTASPEEVARLMAAWDIYDDEELSEMIAEVTADFKDSEIERNKEKLNGEQPLKIFNKPSRLRYFVNGSWIKRIAIFIPAIAAAYLLVWMLNKPKQLKYACDGMAGNRELPTGRYTCRLILANNCTILIDSTYRGVILSKDNMEILQPQPGVIEYRTTGMVSKGDLASNYNIVETSAGQQYLVKLPDGTQVRLNAASSVRFPVDFSHNNRIIDLTGEAFFNVVPGNKMPLYVRTGNSEIKVLGTTFNVRAYTGNTIAALLTGSLEIKSSSEAALLNPGQKATVWSNSRMDRDTIVVAKVDTLQITSWKNANRIYSNALLRDFVSDMGRWYNLEIVNLGCVPAYASITVSICYDAPVDDFLTILRKVGLRLVKVGNKITFCTSLPDRLQ